MAQYICQNPACKQSFTSTNRNPKYCSTVCKYKMLSTRTVMTCDNPACGKAIVVRPRDVSRTHHYCSEACQFYKTTEQRFWSKVDKYGPMPPPCPERGPCWLWQASTNGKKGYGRFAWTSQNGHTETLPHRYSYFLHHGTIPDGLFVLHHCDVRLCVNPDHLFLGTNTDNMQDASRKGRTNQGEKSSNAKLTPRDVYEIRALEGQQSAEQTANQYGVNGMQIGRIWRRERWGHLP